MTHEAAIPNPALEPLSILIGEWTTISSHPALPGVLHGHATCEWIESGAFLMMRSAVEEPGVPSATAIFGSDDDAEAYSMLYFDERGVSRKYDSTLRENVWTIWRNVPDFPQRFTGTIVDHGDTIIGVWEMPDDNGNWKRDLEVTYTRVV